MSRYTLKPKSNEFEVVVGWDRPLAQFFAQVFRNGAEEDEALVLWDDYQSIDALAEALRPYGVLPDVTREQLAADSGRPARPSGPILRPELVSVHGVRCSVEQRPHPLGGTALCLYIGEGDERELYALPTAYLPGARLAANETLVKDYSENTGMLAALVEAGVVVPTGRTVPSGYVDLQVVTITEVRP